jgi:pimeloyl-ACP methyl ester carboxylesterase
VRAVAPILGLAMVLVIPVLATAQAALAAPAGPYQLGTQRVVTVDPTRPDPVAPAEPRRLVVQVWYPAQPGGHDRRAPYVPELGELAHDLAEATPELDLRKVGTSARLDAAPLAGHSFPVVIFSHGMNSARYFYTALVQDLASHGFVVAAIDHPFWSLASAYDGRHRVSLAQSMASRDRLTSEQIDGLMQDGVGLMAEDQALVAARLIGLLPRLRRMIEGQPVGVLGHSMGGMAATEACGRFRVFVACASLDGLVWAREGFTPAGEPPNPVAKPFLLLTSPQFLPADLSTAIIRYRRAWREPQLCLLAGGRHNSASDLPQLRAAAASGDQPDPGPAAEAIRRAVAQFFLAELAGDTRRLAPPDSRIRGLPGAPSGACRLGI